MTIILGKHWEKNSSELLFINIFKNRSPCYVLKTENSECLRTKGSSLHPRFDAHTGHKGMHTRFINYAQFCFFITQLPRKTKQNKPAILFLQDLQKKQRFFVFCSNSQSMPKAVPVHNCVFLTIRSFSRTGKQNTT